MEHNRIRAGARRLLALSCAAAAVLLFGSGAAGQTQTPALSYGEPVASGEEAVLRDPSGALELRADLLTGRVTVQDERTGTLWASNPEKPEEDIIAYGINQSRIQSQLLVTYKGASNTMEETNDKEAAGEGNKSIAAYREGDTLTLVYTFEELGFVVPLQYRLSEGRMTASVPAAGIRETKGNILAALTILPFFGAGSTTESGYLLVPDGSGALMNFNNGRTNEGRLTLDTLYGDRSVTDDKRPPATQPVLLPGFGICRGTAQPGDTAGTAALFAYATDGAAAGQITLNTAGRETGQNYIYYTFLHRNNAVEMLLDRTYAAKAKLICDTADTGAQSYEMSYFFMEPGKTDLAGMADACSWQLFGREASSAAGDVPLFLDMFMGVRVQENFLGIPYHTLRPLTTFSQAQAISDDLRGAGVASVTMRLRGIDADGAYAGRLDTAFRADRKLGGLDGFLTLQETENTAVYPDMELTMFTKSGGGVSALFDASIDLLRDTVRLPAFRLAAGDVNDELPARRLLKAFQIPTVTAKLAASLNKAGVKNAAAASLGLAPYPDYSRSHVTSIGETAHLLEQAAEALGKRGGLMLEAPGAAVLPHADTLLHMPTTSSGYNLTDTTVPFLQMVLSGYLPYAAEDAGSSGDRETMLLRSVEGGSALSFSLMDADYSQVTDTPLDSLYAATYAQQRETILALYARSRAALSGVYGRRITGYRILAADQRETVYDDGTAVLVNYADQPVVWRGQTVPARSCAAAKEG